MLIKSLVDIHTGTVHIPAKLLIISVEMLIMQYSTVN